MDTYAIFGSGGFGREVMPVASNLLNLVLNETHHKIVFVVDNPLDEAVNGYKQISFDEFSNMDCKKYFNIAVADSKQRERIAQRLIEIGAKPFDIIAPESTTKMDCNDIGEGSIICPYSTVTSNAKIGKYFQSNIYSYVAHDCVIGDYVTFAPRVSCNGGVIIENHAYIGTGAIIKQSSEKQKIVIGEGAIVGMGAVVTKSVPPFTTVVGNPARILSKK